MTDYPTALAAARECLDNEGHRATDALRDLIAALDAARGQAVWQFRMACFPNSWTDISYENVDQWKAGGFDVRCLFAAPPAAAVPEVLCTTCGQPTMHMGSMCYGCTQAAMLAAAAWKGE